MKPSEEDEGSTRNEAAVVVLGDVGRSPRMCNHAKMLADEGFDVKLVGFFDSEPGDVIMEHPRIRIIGIQAPPDSLDSLPPFVQLPIKLVWNAVTLLLALLFQTSFFNLRVILMQNPPALPTIPVCFLVAKLKCATFSIDWHNYMYSILKDKYDLTDEQFEKNDGKKAKIVRCVHFLEGLFGRLSDYNLCVTDAMRRDLIEKWNVLASTFYDRPPTWKFGRATSLDGIHELYHRLARSESVLKGSGPEETILTRRDPDGSVHLLPSRPLVLISSTSWTPDEKFEILLDALVRYENESNEDRKLPRLLMFITGKGPLKAAYLEEIRRRNLQNIDVLTPWLEADDYPKLLASADIGISLHTSTSGVDLPMKVVDMFGVRVPVLAKKFRCIGELVEENENGYLFENFEELARRIVSLARGFPSDCADLDRLKSNMTRREFESWEVMWHRSAAPGADLRMLENGASRRLRATTQVLALFVLFVILPVHYLMGTFSL